MASKRISILYWVFTLLFSGMMIYSSVGGLGPNQKTIEIFHNYLGYPIYFIKLISWAKIAGAVVILIPGLKKLKEWAYAGLFIDLTAAVYSGIAASGRFDPLMLTMLAWFIPGILSYVFWNRKLKIESAIHQ